jgi:predicted nucleic acid-binding protein
MPEKPELVLWPYGPKGYRFPDKLYLDTNFLVAVVNSADRLHVDATVLYQAILLQQQEREGSGQPAIELGISPFTLNEAWWIILSNIIDFTEMGYDRLSTIYKKAPEKLQTYLPQLRSLDKAINRIPALKILSIPNSAADTARELVLNQAAAPADAFHIATAVENEFVSAVTHDQDWVKYGTGYLSTIIRF